MRRIISVFMFILSIVVITVWAILLVPILVISVFQIVIVDGVLHRDTWLLADRWVDVLDKYTRWAIGVTA